MEFSYSIPYLVVQHKNEFSQNLHFIWVHFSRINHVLLSFFFNGMPFVILIMELRNLESKQTNEEEINTHNRTILVPDQYQYWNAIKCHAWNIQAKMYLSFHHMNESHPCFIYSVCCIFKGDWLFSYTVCAKTLKDYKKYSNVQCGEQSFCVTIASLQCKSHLPFNRISCFQSFPFYPRSSSPLVLVFFSTFRKKLVYSTIYR